MKHTAFALFAAVSALAVAPAALAASDYFLKIEGVEGEAVAPIEIQSWSWGATNSGSSMSSSRVVSPRDAASGQASGKRSAGLRESPTRASTGKSSRAPLGDLDGDGRADLHALQSVSEVQGFSLTLDQAAAGELGRCAKGKHIAKATITMRASPVMELSDVAVSSCAVAPAASSRQTQGATFGERCVAGQCPASSSVTLTLTGQMRHQKTGHVTLLK